MVWKPGAVVVHGPKKIRVNGFQPLEGARVSHLGQKAKVTSQGGNQKKILAESLFFPHFIQKP